MSQSNTAQISIFSEPVSKRKKKARTLFPTAPVTEPHYSMHNGPLQNSFQKVDHRAGTFLLHILQATGPLLLRKAN